MFSSLICRYAAPSDQCWNGNGIFPRCSDVMEVLVVDPYLRLKQRCQPSCDLSPNFSKSPSATLFSDVESVDPGSCTPLQGNVQNPLLA